MIECLKNMQCETFLLSSKKVDPILIKRNFGMEILVDDTIIIPAEFPKLPYFMNLIWKYSKPSLLRNKCNLVLDASSNLLLPFVDITYFHGADAILTIEQESAFKFSRLTTILNIFIQKTLATNPKRLILANSHFTAQRIQKLIGIKPLVIHPPVNTNDFSLNSEISKKKSLSLYLGFQPKKTLN